MRSPILSVLLLLGGCASERPPAPSQDTPVRLGLDWLARHQSPDGSWGAISFQRRCVGPKCEGAGEPDSENLTYDVGVTGLAVLAFLGAGEEHPSTNVARAIEWLLGQQDVEGCLAPRHHKYLYEHAMATLALCETLRREHQPRMIRAAQKAVDYLVAAQNPGKGWRYASRSGDNDSSVTAWCVLALGSAQLAGLHFPKAAFLGALSWYGEVTGDEGDRITGYVSRRYWIRGLPGRNEEFDEHPTMNACACLARYIVERKRGDPFFSGLDLLLRDLPDAAPMKTDSYYWFFATAALRLCEGSQGARWESWSTPLRILLLATQERGGCKDGSWDPRKERWFVYGPGRVYVTASNILSLELLSPHPGAVTFMQSED